VAEHTAQAHALCRARFDVAIAAGANKHHSFLRLYDPVAVLLVLLRRPFEFRDMDGLFYLILGSGIFHTFFMTL
jgi:hypothetical protein